MSNNNKSISNELFLKLHQLQINLINNTSKQTINDYYKNLIDLFESEKSLDDESTQSESSKLIEFLLLPVLKVLKRFVIENSEKYQSNSDSNEILLKCCYLTLSKIKLFNLELFKDLLNICSILLSKNKLPKPNDTSKAEKQSSSEEFLCTCFQFVQILIKRSSKVQILDYFYKFNNLPTIGLLVTIFLDVLSETNSMEVRIEAINCLKTLTYYTQLNYDNYLVMRQDLIGTFNYQNRIAIIFASFLPGISINLIQKFLLSENLKLLNHKIICSSLELFGHVIATVFNDCLLNEKSYEIYFNSCSDESNETEKSKLAQVKSLIINRIENPNWLENSSDKMFMLIDRILDALIINDNYHVKLNLVKFCSIVSNQCYITLNKYLPKLLRILVTFAANSDYQFKPNENKVDISKEACKSISLIEKKELTNETDRKYIPLSRFSVLDSCMEEILLRLPRIIKTKTDSKNEINDEYRLSHLKTLYGYLKLIGGYQTADQTAIYLKDFFQTNTQNLNQLLQGLTNCITFDYKSLNNFYEINNLNEFANNSSSNLSNYMGLKTYLDDKIVYDQLSLICSYLGKSDLVYLIIDELLNSDLIYYDNQRYKIEIMFLINLILVGLSTQKETLPSSEMSSIITLVLSNFLNDFNELTEDKLETIEVIEKRNESKLNDLSITNKRNQMIIQTCLTLECIRISSKCLSTDDYNLFLIDTLYFTLENYLNTNLLIRAVSTNCLNELASNLGYENIQSLLSSNFDYIMNDLILKSNNQIRTVRYDDNNPNKQQNLDKQSSHVFVLCSLLDISNSNLVPYLERLIDDYFFGVQINANNFDLLLGVCRVMMHMSKAMRRWYPIKFNFIEYDINNQNKIEDFTNLNLKMYADAKKKKDYTKSFVDTLLEIDSELNKANRRFDDIPDEDINTKDTDNELNEDEQDNTDSKKSPIHIKLQIKCMQLCTHLISHPFKQVRLQIIDLIRELSKNLAEYTNDFLPLVHKLWSPICHRFTLDDLIVKSKIMFLLFDLSVLCSDFISSRFCKEFLPRLCSFMNEQAKVSLKSSKLTSTQGNLGDPTYIYSQAFKLQCAILSNIDKMAVLFEIKELELENLIESIVLVYLDKKQPKRLQNLSIQAVKNCSLIDADIVWLTLHYILPFQSIKLDENLNEYKDLNFSSEIKLKYNFQFNDEVLLNLMQIFNQI